MHRGEDVQGTVQQLLMSMSNFQTNAVRSQEVQQAATQRNEQLLQQLLQQQTVSHELSAATKAYILERSRLFMHEENRAPERDQVEAHVRTLLQDPQAKVKLNGVNEGNIKQVIELVGVSFNYFCYATDPYVFFSLKFIKKGNDYRGQWSENARVLLRAYAQSHNMPLSTIEQRKQVIMHLSDEDAEKIVQEVFSGERVTEHDRTWLWSKVFTAWVRDKPVRTAGKRKHARVAAAPPPKPDFDSLLDDYEGVQEME